MFVWTYVCLSVCVQALLLIRTHGYCELCSTLILCHSLFMEARAHTTAAHTDDQYAKTTPHQEVNQPVYHHGWKAGGREGNRWTETHTQTHTRGLFVEAWPTFLRAQIWNCAPSMPGWVWLELVHTLGGDSEPKLSQSLCAVSSSSSRINPFGRKPSVVVDRK